MAYFLNKTHNIPINLPAFQTTRNVNWRLMKPLLCFINLFAEIGSGTDSEEQELMDDMERKERKEKERRSGGPTYSAWMIWTEACKCLLFLYKNPDVWGILKEPISALSSQNTKCTGVYSTGQAKPQREGRTCRALKSCFRLLANCLDAAITEHTGAKESQNYFK